MKLNLPVTDTERTYPADTRLISVTDTKGIITSANEAFAQVSGYSLEELFRKNHNLVRHPDMPPAAFANLWQTLQGAQPWMGIVKNRTKNGDYYWVDAYVAPELEGGRVVGYQSVRVKPEAECVKRAEKLYQQLREGKNVKPLLPLHARGKYFLGLMLVQLSSLGFFALSGSLSLGQFSAALAAGLVVSFGIADWLTAPLRKAAGEAREIFDNSLMAQIYTGAQDEVGQLRLGLLTLKAKMRTVIGRIEDSIHDLSSLASETAASVEATTRGVRRQQSDTDQLATAMTEMTATVQEVARNIGEAAKAAQQADQQTADGKQVVGKTIAAIDSLAQEVEQAVDVIRKLNTDSGEIGSVLDVIRGIAEQTNLLALNAAIEAARAGEQGRGFAVVADEVRTLARRTQQSTQEIQEMIEKLQAGAAHAVGVMEKARDKTSAGVEQAAKAGQSLDVIRKAVITITDMNTQIASAAEEQTAVAEEINRNISSISQVACETAAVSTQTAAGSEELARTAQQFESLVQQSRL